MTTGLASKDIEKKLKQLRKFGWRTELNSNGHVYVFLPKGKDPVIIGSRRGSIFGQRAFMRDLEKAERDWQLQNPHEAGIVDL